LPGYGKWSRTESSKAITKKEFLQEEIIKKGDVKNKKIKST
jgi:hypothetical protein